MQVFNGLTLRVEGEEVTTIDSSSCCLIFSRTLLAESHCSSLTQRSPFQIGASASGQTHEG